jgi:hypothetical protein
MGPSGREGLVGKRAKWERERSKWERERAKWARGLNGRRG